MIFVTVGHQTPFDRLIRAMDEWATSTGERSVFAQVGRSDIKPRSFPAVQFLSPDEFDRRMREAKAIVGHAGTGTIIAALTLGKPLLVMPRLSSKGETRNDHQVPTAAYFSSQGYVLAAADEKELGPRMTELLAYRPQKTLPDAASPQLIARLRSFIFDEPRAGGAS